MSGLRQGFSPDSAGRLPSFNLRARTGAGCRRRTPTPGFSTSTGRSERNGIWRGNAKGTTWIATLMEIECRGEEMICEDEQDHSDLTAEILFKCLDTVRSDFQGIL